MSEQKRTILGIQGVQGVPPFKLVALSSMGEVLYCRTGWWGDGDIRIPKDISKQVARTLLKDARGRTVNEWIREERAS